MTRWLYKVVEVPRKLFGGKQSERVQAELDRQGLQGWELVSVMRGHAGALDSARLYFKRPA
ncbi:MAG: DUF4177 domain-containing protein [Gammaproteobacteria bacterium]|nr:DUF4177 domain-containing protein [Gammaproteobacteria bacterium]